MIPTNFYKVEDSNVFSADFFASIFGVYQNPNYTSLARVRWLQRRGLPASCPNDSSRDTYWNQGTFFNNYAYYCAKDPQKQANAHDVEVLQHRLAQPRAQVQLQLPPADRRLGHGLAGRPELRHEYSYSSSTRRSFRAACGRSTRT